MKSVKICLYCGRQFWAESAKRIYCSKRCGQQHWRKTHPEQYKAQNERGREKWDRTRRAKIEVARLAKEKEEKEREATRHAKAMKKLWADIKAPIGDDEPLGRWM